MKSLAPFILCLCLCAGLLLFGNFSLWQTPLLFALLFGEGGYQLWQMTKSSPSNEQVILNRIATLRALRV